MNELDLIVAIYVSQYVRIKPGEEKKIQGLEIGGFALHAADLHKEFKRTFETVIDVK